jgi:hypothetical protein
MRQLVQASSLCWLEIDASDDDVSTACDRIADGPDEADGHSTPASRGGADSTRLDEGGST